jgi:hypothetical protein
MLTRSAAYYPRAPHKSDVVAPDLGDEYKELIVPYAHPRAPLAPYFVAPNLRYEEELIVPYARPRAPLAPDVVAPYFKYEFSGKRNTKNSKRARKVKSKRARKVKSKRARKVKKI